MDEQLVTVFLTNATRTSAGPGPGQKELPAAEAAALVRNGLARYGGDPPDGLALSDPRSGQ
jgi:hypothetical protein